MTSDQKPKPNRLQLMEELIECMETVSFTYFDSPPAARRRQRKRDAEALRQLREMRDTLRAAESN